MSEKRILISSLLKPVNDTRMYGKIGLSLCRLPQVRVHVCGYAAPAPSGLPPNMELHPLFYFKRLSLGRLTAQTTYYRFLKRLNPDLIIVCTHELLLPSYLYAKERNCKLVYDVQENYTLNLTKQQNYAQGLKQLMAFGVGNVEKLLAKGVAHFLVAEQSYLQELPFLGHNYTLIENKYKANTTGQQYINTPVRLSQEPLRLLYTGTIAVEYGIFEAISLARKLHSIAPDTRLTVIGYCAKEETWQRLLQEVQGISYIRLIGGRSLVPHDQIIREVARANVALLPYQPNESTFRCIPTKLYEYMAHAVPMLVQQNPLWHRIVELHQAGLSIDFTTTPAAVLLKQLKGREYYTNGIPEDVFWQTEEAKLLPLIENILK
ncbi:MAG: glycosyltransferase [Hymenobacteraceae bacterium]|nr:glycosyltransferase [Hymenobacteraceae bacterium]MDX5421127.1 glycosyltransferase [Hymenobacteraceae bacterium]